MSQKNRKGIILAGGAGTRLYPLTNGISKQLLPVYDKPMIYYPLSVMMLANIKDILVISTPTDTPLIRNMMGDGSRFGINLSYEVQHKPSGIAQALIIAEGFLNKGKSALILGDNLFFGQDLTRILVDSSKQTTGSRIFGYQVKNPESFGVVEFSKHKHIISIQEKPKKPNTNYIIPGIYFFDENASAYAKKLNPSKRGELEITDLIKKYHLNNTLELEILGRGTSWVDMGTIKSLNLASDYIKNVQSIQGNQIANIDEIAYRKGWVSKNKLKESILKMGSSDYKDYLNTVINSPSHHNNNLFVV